MISLSITSACIVRTAGLLLVYFVLVEGRPANQETDGSKPKLFIMMLDGARYDYPQRDLDNLPAFQRLMKEGAHVPYVIPSFPSVSYLNWASITTGLYPENSGFVGNKMWDPQYNDWYLGGGHRGDYIEHWWNQSEPLWITATKAGLNVAHYYWDGCQVSIGGIKPKFCIPWSQRTDACSNDLEEEDDIHKSAKEAIHRLILGDFDLVLFYHETIDTCGHRRGPDSEETYRAVRIADNHISFILREIDRLNATDSVNFYLLSDHGMGTVSKYTHIPGDLIDFKNDVRTMIAGIYASIFAKDEEAKERIYQTLKDANLKHVTVHKKEDIPEEFHYKNSRLVGDILMFTDPGVAMIWDFKDWPTTETVIQNPNPHKVETTGDHGWWPGYYDEMRALMYAKGPAFKSNHISDAPINMVDHYQIFARILNLEPQPNNGTWSNVADLFN